MKEMLYGIVEWISKIHGYILGLNDAYEYNFTDKQLHFLIIGILGMVLIFAIYPLFKRLASKNHIMTITFIYVFTLIVVITFAIEIGQKVSNTGKMEFADIMMGVFGFVLMYLIFALIRQICKAIAGLVRRFGKETEAEGTDVQERAVAEKRMKTEVNAEANEFADLEKLIEREALDEED